MEFRISTDQLIGQATNVLRLFHNQIDRHQVHGAKRVFSIKLINEYFTYDRYAYIAIFLDIRMPNFRNKFLDKQRKAID
jgi:hypothetical protein